MVLGVLMLVYHWNTAVAFFYPWAVSSASSLCLLQCQHSSEMRFGAHGVHARISYTWVQLLVRTCPSSLYSKAFQMLDILRLHWMFSLILPVFSENKAFTCLLISVLQHLWNYIDFFHCQRHFPKVTSPLLDHIKGFDHTTLLCLHDAFAGCFQPNLVFRRSFGKLCRTATNILGESWFPSKLQKMCKTYPERVQPPDGRTQLIGGAGSSTWPPAGWYSSLQPRGVKCSTQNESWDSLVAEQSNNLSYHMSQTI